MDECKSSSFFPPRREKKSPSVTNGAIINRANDKLVLHCFQTRKTLKMLSPIAPRQRILISFIFDFTIITTSNIHPTFKLMNL